MSFLSSALDSWVDGGTAGEGAAPTDYVRTRRGRPTNTGGVVVPAIVATATISASIQPYSGNKLAALQAANETTEIRLAMTEGEAVLDVATQEQVADVVTIVERGVTSSWVVVDADHWTENGAHWTRAYLARTSAP